MTPTQYIQDSCFSDLFKDINGFRPRGMIVERWLAMTVDELKREEARMIEELNEVMAREAREQDEAARRFEARVAEVIATGAGDRATAINWLCDAEESNPESQCYRDTGYLEYTYGLKFGYLKGGA